MLSTESFERVVEKAGGNDATVTELRISEYNVSDDFAADIAEAIKCSAHLTSVYIYRCGISSEGVKYIAMELKSNNSIRSLVLSSNQIDGDGARYIAEALTVNQAIMMIDLSNNSIGNVGVQHIADAIKVNKVVQHLCLHNIQMTHIGAQYLAESLAVNQAIRRLEIRYNNIGDEGVKHIAGALKVNKVVQSLSLQNIQITHVGARYIADALTVNQTITSLDLSSNNIQDVGAKHLAEAIKANKSITHLNLNYTRISDLAADTLYTVVIKHGHNIIEVTGYPSSFTKARMAERVKRIESIADAWILYVESTPKDIYYTDFFLRCYKYNSAISLFLEKKYKYELANAFYFAPKAKWNSHFLHSAGVCKGLPDTVLIADMWIKIGSYIELSDIKNHPRLEQGRVEEVEQERDVKPEAASKAHYILYATAAVISAGVVIYACRNTALLQSICEKLMKQLPDVLSQYLER